MHISEKLLTNKQNELNKLLTCKYLTIVREKVSGCKNNLSYSSIFFINSGSLVIRSVFCFHVLLFTSEIVY